MNPHLDDRALLALAQETGLDPARVRALHDEEWRKLDRKARIKVFLPLLVMKHLRDRCEPARPH